MTKPLRERLINLAVLCGAVVLTLVAAEIALQILSRIGLVPSFTSRYAITVEDDVLAVKLPPRAYPEIDDWGFRNQRVPERSPIVALGDSQTYGYNASSHESWPKQLAELTGTFVYNMGVGSYAPPQYFYLLERALELDPETIVLGVYPGNDLLETCIYFTRPYWRSFARAHGIDISACPKPEENLQADRPGLLARWRPLVRNSQVLMLVKQAPIAQRFVARRRDLRIAEKAPENFYVANDADVKTIVMLQTRLGSMDPRSEAVRTGRAITGLLYESIIERAGSVRLIALFIPTKANVLYDHLKARGYELPEKFHQLVAIERQHVTELSRFFHQRGVETADARPRLESAILADDPLYLDYSDGHPTALGYRMMAEAAFERYSATRSTAGQPPATN